MIKGVIMQIEAEVKLGYNSKMAPETKTTHGSFAAGKRLFSTLAKSRMSSAVKSAFCEPSHSITSSISMDSIRELPNWGENYLDLPHLASETESVWTGNNKNIATRIISSFMPHSSPILKKCSADELNKNSWMKRMMPQRSILDHLNMINIGEQEKSFISYKPVASVDNINCVKEMTSQTSLMIKHVAHSSSQGVDECESAMDNTSVTCCEQGGGIQVPLETSGGCVCGLVSEQNTDICKGSVNSVSEIKISSPAILPFSCTSEKISSGEESTDNTSIQNYERSRVSGASMVMSKATSVCGNRKKKTRPSAKKRHRRKRQRGAEDHVEPAREELGRQKEASVGSNTSNDVLTFMNDLTDSIDIAEHHLFNSKKAASSLSSNVCSLFIRASDLFDDDEADFDIEDFQNCSEDVIDFSDTSVFLPLLSSSDPLLAETGCMLMFDVTKSSSSNPDAECHSQNDDDQLWIDPEVKKLIDDANKKWEENYGNIDIDDDFVPTKVKFPSEESDLQTVFVLSPDEASKEARIGQWQIFARDRQRFRHRIAETERAISYCLEPIHREKIHQQLYGQ